MMKKLSFDLTHLKQSFFASPSVVNEADVYSANSGPPLRRFCSGANRALAKRSFRASTINFPSSTRAFSFRSTV